MIVKYTFNFYKNVNIEEFNNIKKGYYHDFCKNPCVQKNGNVKKKQK